MEHKTCIKQFSLVTENLCRCCLMRFYVQSTVGDSANSVIPLYQHQNHYSIPWLAVFNCWEHTDSNLEEILPCLFVNGSQQFWTPPIGPILVIACHSPQRPLFVTQVCTVILPLSMPCAFQGTNLRYIHFKNTPCIFYRHWDFQTSYIGILDYGAMTSVWKKMTVWHIAGRGSTEYDTASSKFIRRNETMGLTLYGLGFQFTTRNLSSLESNFEILPCMTAVWIKAVTSSAISISPPFWVVCM